MYTVTLSYRDSRGLQPQPEQLDSEHEACSLAADLASLHRSALVLRDGVPVARYVDDGDRKRRVWMP